MGTRMRGNENEGETYRVRTGLELAGVVSEPVLTQDCIDLQVCRVACKTCQPGANRIPEHFTPAAEVLPPLPLLTTLISKFEKKFPAIVVPKPIVAILGPFCSVFSDRKVWVRSPVVNVSRTL